MVSGASDQGRIAGQSKHKGGKSIWGGQWVEACNRGSRDYALICKQSFLDHFEPLNKLTYLHVITNCRPRIYPLWMTGSKGKSHLFLRVF